MFIRNEKGFTLIEMMIVIAIIGLLVAIVVPDLIKTREESTIEATKASMRGLQSALELYFTRYKHYPATTDGLAILIDEGYLQEDADRDPWGRNYFYEPISQEGADDTTGSGTMPTNYYLNSLGPDAMQGTEDDIAAPINPNRHTKAGEDEEEY